MYRLFSKSGSTASPNSPPSPDPTLMENRGSGARTPSRIILRVPPRSVNRAAPSGVQSMLQGIRRFLATVSAPTPGWRSTSVAFAVNVRLARGVTFWSGISARTGAVFTSFTRTATSCDPTSPELDAVIVMVWSPFCVSVGVHLKAPVSRSMVAPSGPPTIPYVGGPSRRCALVTLTAKASVARSSTS